MLEYTEQPLTPKVVEIEFKGAQNFFVLTVKLCWNYAPAE